MKEPIDIGWQEEVRQCFDGILYGVPRRIEMDSEPTGELIRIEPQPLLYQPTSLWWYKKETYAGDVVMQNRLQEDAPSGTMAVMEYGVWYWQKTRE